MKISALAKQVNAAESAVRYYEAIGLLPRATRLANGYRDYDAADVERLKLVVGARSLDLSLDDIAEILALRDRREAPCRVLLDRLEEKAADVGRRIAALQRLEGELRRLHQLGQTFPTDDVDGKACVCHLVSRKAEAHDGND